MFSEDINHHESEVTRLSSQLEKNISENFDSDLVEEKHNIEKDRLIKTI